MRTLLGIAAALAIAIGFSGCATAGGGTPCEKCDYGYVATGKSITSKVGCIVDGKVVDCSKNPSECPGCKGMK